MYAVPTPRGKYHFSRQNTNYAAKKKDYGKASEQHKDDAAIKKNGEEP
jgi:hypothetical protein